MTSVSALFSSNGSIDGGGGGGPSSGSAATTASPQKRPSTTATNTTTPATSSCSSLSSSNNQITVQPQPEHFYFKLTRTPDLILDPVSLQPLPFADVRSGDEFWCAPDHARDGVWITGNSLRVHRSFRFATNCIIVVNNYRSTSTTSSARSSRSSMDNNSINNNNNTDHLKTYIPPSPTPPVPTSSSTTSAVQNRINSHISSKASHVNPAIAAAAPISSSSRIHPTSSSSSSKTLARTLAAFNSVTSVSRATLGRSRLSGAELNLDIAESVTKQLVRITKDFTRPSSSSLRSLNEEDMALVPKPSPIPPSQATATDFINERDMIQLYGKIKEMITLEENFW